MPLETAHRLINLLREEVELRFSEVERLRAVIKRIDEEWPQCPTCGAIRPLSPDPRLEQETWNGTVAEWLSALRESSATRPPKPIRHNPDCDLARALTP